MTNTRSPSHAESPAVAKPKDAQLQEEISERQQAEEELRKSEWRLRYATESARLTYVEVDLVDGGARTPDNFAAVMGYSPPAEQSVDAQVGARRLLEHVVAQDRLRVAAALAEFVGGASAGQVDYRVVGDDQIERWIETRWSVQIGPEGRPLKSIATNLDISERKKSEAAVRESEERYRNLFNSIDEGFCVIEVIFDRHGKPDDWRYLEVNPSFEKHCGMHNVLGRRVREIAPDLEEYWFETYGKVALTGESVRFVNEAKALNRWVDLYAFRIGGTDSRRVAIVFNDVTAAKRAEIALHESMDRYQSLFSSIDEGFCIVEMIFDEQQQPVDYRFLEVNPTFGKQTGLRDAIGKRMRDLIPNLEAHWFETFGKVARTGEAIRFVNVAKDMGNRWFDVYACQVGGADSRKVALVFNDITARKQLDEDLRTSEQRLRFVMDSMPQKVVTTTADGAVDYFNPQWSEFTGLSLEQIKGEGWQAFLHPDDLAETVRSWQHSITTGEASLREQRFRRADGEYRWHLSRTVPMRDAAGKVVMWIGSSTEVHEVKEADRRKDEFLAMLAHELRNPLAPILSMVEVMKRADGSSDAIQPALRTMERQLRHMTRLIDDLLDVGRISQGKIDLRREKVELASVVRQVVEAARPACESAQQELTVTLPLQPVILDADPVRLTQVFGNLIHNSCKFTKPGGRISLTAVRQGGDVLVTVQDSGIGIPSAMLPRIFDLFTQGEQQLEQSASGLGIGLTLVRRLVELHGGSVQAASEGLDRGSEFVVRLPILIEQPAALSAKPPVGKPTPAPARRILVVDDNHDAAECLAMLLQLTGNQTQLAFDGVAAVAAVLSFRPDVILMDIGMPKLDGYEAAQQIRQQVGGKGIILVALTGWGQDKDREKTAAAGFDHHLVKPVEYATLTTLLASIPGVAAAADKKGIVR